MEINVFKDVMCRKNNNHYMKFYVDYLEARINLLENELLLYQEKTNSEIIAILSNDLQREREHNDALKMKLKALEKDDFESTLIKNYSEKLERTEKIFNVMKSQYTKY